jgi:uncharacterized repeat protein (TIGR03803 family)
MGLISDFEQDGPWRCVIRMVLVFALSYLAVSSRGLAVPAPVQTICAFVDSTTSPTSLTQGQDGTLYVSGLNILKVTLSGTLTTLVKTSNDNSVTSIITGNDGSLYGIIALDGTNSDGAIFQLTTTGSMTILHDFGDYADGLNPFALLQAHNGNFYGIDWEWNGGERLFMYASGVVSTGIYSFGFASTLDDETITVASLTQGNDSDANFYGTTSGNVLNWGTLFKITPGGTLTTLHTFTGADGGDPCGFAEGSDGNFYGVSAEGGVYQHGTLFQFSPADGIFTTLYSFTGDKDGARPVALAHGNDGHFYGLTSEGGANNYGTVFSIPDAISLPLAVDDFVYLRGKSPVAIHVLANDVSRGNRALSVVGVTAPSHGSVSVNHDNSITYTPSINFATYTGTDQFTYTISDASGTKSTATVRISNPFSFRGGIYAGPLPYDGYMYLTLAGDGMFTCKLSWNNSTYSLAGSFANDGTFQKTLPGNIPLKLTLNLWQPANNLGAYMITGEIDQFGDTLTLYRSLYTNANPASEAGNYTVLLPAFSGTDNTVPSGTGYGLLSVDRSGSTRIVGKLSDGTAFSSGVPLVAKTGYPLVLNAEVVIAADLPYQKGASGFVGGTVSFADIAGVSDCSGTFGWTKYGSYKTGSLYPDGFVTSMSLIGSRYEPHHGAPVLNLLNQSPNALIRLSEPDFANTLSSGVTISISNKITVDCSRVDNLKMTINATSGMFTGSFVHPVSGRTVNMQGVLFQKQNIGGGFFVGPTQSGAVNITSQ